MKRYQVYLDPRSVGIIDEFTTISPFTRSQILREAADGAAARLGRLLALFKSPRPDDYDWLDKLTGSITVGDGTLVNISENVDEIYYR